MNALDRETTYVCIDCKTEMRRNIEAHLHGVPTCSQCGAGMTMLHDVLTGLVSALDDIHEAFMALVADRQKTGTMVAAIDDALGADPEPNASTIERATQKARDVIQGRKKKRGKPPRRKRSS